MSDDLKKFETTCTSGTVLVEKNRVIENLYYIKDGTVSVYMNDDEGNEHLFEMLSEGDIIGAIEMTTKKKALGTVVALSEVTLVTIPIDTAKIMFSSNPELIVRLAMYLGERCKRFVHEVIRLRTEQHRADIESKRMSEMLSEAHQRALDLKEENTSLEALLVEHLQGSGMQLPPS